MAELSDMLAAAGGIPTGIIQGYNLGQKLQRDEEKALQDIERARIANELLGFSTAEYKGQEATGARLAGYGATEATQRRAGLLGGIDIEAITNRRPEMVAGAEAGITGRALQQQRLSEIENLIKDLAPQQAQAIRGALANLISGQPIVARQQEQTLAGLSDQAADRQASVIVQQNWIGEPGREYDSLTAAYNAAPDDRTRFKIDLLRKRQNDIDVANAANTTQLSQVLRRQNHAVIESPGGFTVYSITMDETGQPRSQLPVGTFKTIEDVKRAFIALPGEPQSVQNPPQQRPAPIVPGAAGAAGAGRALGVTQKANTGAAAPAAVPAAAPAAAAPATAPAVAAAAVPAAAAASQANLQQQIIGPLTPTGVVAQAAQAGLPAAIAELNKRIAAQQETENALAALRAQPGGTMGGF